MKHTISKVANTQSSRRSVLKSVVLSGSALSVLPSTWTKPIINSVVLPAHAQTSIDGDNDDDDDVACPMLVVGNSTYSVGSATGTCGLSFEFLSADAATPINVISIVNTAPVGTDAVAYPAGTSGAVTSASGLSVSWLGQAIGAPFACLTDTPVPINDITFTVSYNCVTDPAVQTMTFELIAVAASL